MAAPRSEYTLDPSTSKNQKSELAEDEPDFNESSSFPRPVEALLRLRALEALRQKEFRLLWYGTIFTSMATWMDSIARGWLMYELTHSSWQLGLVRGVQAIPTLLFSPIAGSAADLYSRKSQMIVAQVIDVILYGWVATMIFTGEIQPWIIYVTSVGLATVQAFQQPSRASMVSDSVPPKYLTNALGLNAVVFNSARSAGPALAGILIAAFGTGASYSVQALFYLLATIWTFSLRADDRSVPVTKGHGGRGETFGHNIVEGWKFSWRNDEVRISLLIVTISMFLLIPFTTLLPVYARDILHVGASGQGLLLTSMGIGALFSSILVASLGDRMPRGLFMLGGVALYGILVMIFSASTWYPLSIITMFFIGLCHVTSHALIQTVIQSYSPPEFRGRTMAIFHMTQVILVIGAMFIGGLAAMIGAQWAATSMALTGTALMIAIFLMMPKARQIK